MKKLRLPILLFLVGAISFASAQIVFAYRLTYDKIINTITYTMENTFGETSILHMNHACYEWNQAAGKTLILRQASPQHSDYGGYYKKDGKNYVYKQPSYIDPYLAENHIWGDLIGVGPFYEVKESDINFNTLKSFANSAQPGKYDFYSVALHELGHTIGLDDSGMEANVMHGSLGTNTLRRKLTSDDILGVERIYK